MQAMQMNSNPLAGPYEVDDDRMDKCGIGTSMLSSTSTLCTLCLFNFVTPEDVLLAEDREEVLANARDIMEPFGAISTIGIDDMQANSSLSIGIANMTKGTVIIVKFADATAAAAAARSIDGMVVGGEPIHILLRDDDDAQLVDPFPSDVRFDVWSDTAETSAVVAFVRESTSRSSTSKGAFVLYLENLVTPGDVVDEEEAAEVLGDLMSLCGVFGDISSVWIEELPAPAAPATPATIVAGPRGDPLVLFECLTLADALTILSSLHEGVALGRGGMNAHLFDYSAYHRSDVSPDGVIRLCDSDDNSFAVRIQDFAFLDQLTDDDERQQLVVDVLDLLYPAGAPLDTDVFFLAHGASMVDVIAPLDSLSLMQCMGLMSILESQIVAGDRLHTDLLVLGDRHVLTATVAGDEISADVWAAVGAQTLQAGNVQPTAPDWAKNGALVSVQQYLSREDVAVLKGDTTTAKQGLLQLIRSRISGADQAGKPLFIRRVSVSTEIEDLPDTGSCLVACACFPELSSAESAMLRLDGSVIGGSRISASIAPLPPAIATSTGTGTGTAVADCGFSADAVHSSTGAVEATNAPVGRPTHSDPTLAPAAVPPSKAVSKYIESKAAPKLEKHSEPLMSVKRATVECDGWVTDFLGAIATFQERAKEKDPIKATAKKRYVLGIKQVD